MGARAPAADARGGVATLAATIWLYIIVPKGLLPQQDTGLIIGVTDAAQSISFRAMVARQRAIADIVRKDPDVASVASFVGAGTVNATLNTGRLYINLKPRDQRKAGAAEIIDRLREAHEGRRGHRAVHAGGAGRADRQPRQPHAVPVHPAGRRRGRTGASGRPNWWPNSQTLPELTDVASDQQTGGCS